MAETVNVQMSRVGSFVVLCPRCRKGKEYPGPGAEIPAENPFTFTCTCGTDILVRMNFRQTVRKQVRLPGSVIFGLRRPEACTVEDLSRTGLQLSVPAASALKVGQRAVVSLVLSDRQQSKLTLTGTIRRITPRDEQSVIGVEFVALPAYEAQVIAYYLM